MVEFIISRVQVVLPETELLLLVYAVLEVVCVQVLYFLPLFMLLYQLLAYPLCYYSQTVVFYRVDNSTPEYPGLMV